MARGIGIRGEGLHARASHGLAWTGRNGVNGPFGGGIDHAKGLAKRCSDNRAALDTDHQALVAISDLNQIALLNDEGGGGEIAALGALAAALGLCCKAGIGPRGGLFGQGLGPNDQAAQTTRIVPV